MTDFTPAERSTVIRMPSTANLMIAARDRDVTRDLLPNSFFINKKNSILNGFFTRIGLTELNLNWDTPNVSAAVGNNSITIDVSGVGPNTAPISNNFYTVAQVLNKIVQQLQDISGTTGLGFTISANTNENGCLILPSNLTTYYKFSGILAQQLGLPLDFTQAGIILKPGQTNGPNIQNIKWLDFVSPQLTYNQSLADATSSSGPSDKDVLCRFYFSQDIANPVDQYGFAIFLGYQQFELRRPYNPPKQIRWTANQPIGQLSFQVYDQTGSLANMTVGSGWEMTLQVSEV